MYSIVVNDTIAVAHKLPGVLVCERLHGHNLSIEVKVKSASLNDQGMVVDFRVIKECIRKLDHQYLNDIHEIDPRAMANIDRCPVMPTAENIASYLFREIGVAIGSVPEDCQVEYVRVWESDKAYSEYRL